MTEERVAFKENRRQLGFNIISSVLSFVVGIAISFVLTPFLTSELGKEAYSFYPLSTSITNAMIVVTSALNSIASRFITISLFQEKRDDANKFFSSTLFVDGVLSAFLLVIMAIFILFIDSFLVIPEGLVLSVRMLFTFTFASAIVNVMSTAYGVATFAKNRVELRSIREIGASILRAVLFVCLYFFLPTDVSYIGIVALSVALFNLVIQFIYTKHLLPEINVSVKYISKPHIKELFLSSIWVIINSLGNTLIVSSTLIVLNKMYDISDSSIVSIAMTVPNLMSGIITMLVGVYYPVLTKRYAEGDLDRFAAEIQKVQKIVGGITCATIAVFLAVSKPFYALWVPGENAELLFELTLYLLLPYISISFFWTATYVNTAMNDVKYPALATMLFGLLNLLFQILFSTLELNYRSIVLTSVVSQILWSAFFMPLYLAKSTKKKWFFYYKGFAEICVFSIAIFALTYSCSEFLNINSWFKFILFGGLFGVLSLSVLFFALNPGADFRKVFRRHKK